MAARATLTIMPRPDLGAGTRYFEIDCPHAETSAILIPHESAVLLDDELVRVLLLRHDAAGCRCTRPLWRRYGSAGTPEGAR